MLHLVRKKQKEKLNYGLVNNMKLKTFFGYEKVKLISFGLFRLNYHKTINDIKKDIKEKVNEYAKRKGKEVSEIVYIENDNFLYIKYK